MEADGFRLSGLVDQSTDREVTASAHHTFVPRGRDQTPPTNVRPYVRPSVFTWKTDGLDARISRQTFTDTPERASDCRILTGFPNSRFTDINTRRWRTAAPVARHRRWTTTGYVPIMHRIDQLTARSTPSLVHTHTKRQGNGFIRIPPNMSRWPSVAVQIVYTMYIRAVCLVVDGRRRYAITMSLPFVDQLQSIRRTLGVTSRSSSFDNSVRAR